MPQADPTRAAAFSLVTAVIAEHRTLDTALDTLPPLDARDKAAAHRLAAAVLRHTGTLDAVLEAFLSREPPPAVRRILWLGAAALLFLEAPAHAAVATAVDLTRARKFEPFAKLVNAVLRRVAAGGAALLDGLDSPRLDTPGWAWASWGAEARRIATAHQAEAPLDISAKPGFIPSGERLPTGSFRFPAGTAIRDIAGYAEGDIWVQDAAAALPALVLDAKRGERVLDLCAAPGGKTAQLAAAGAAVTALDRDASRLATLRNNLQRLRLAVEIVEADALSWRAEQKFDAVLLDAPCSATGTIRRHPDLLHLRRPRDIARLAANQDALLDAAAAHLAPNGRLIYAVCSLQPEEGASRIDAACARLGLRRDPLALPALPEAETSAGDLRSTPALWPERGGMDGFFIARLIRS